MKSTLLTMLAFFCLLLPPVCAGATDQAPPAPQRETSLDAGTDAQGVKELLAVATERAVRALAKTDGYFGNKSIRIDVPGELEHLPPYFRDQGYQAQVIAFIQSLNRASEKAAPKAAPLFTDALREMAIDDPQKILNGGDAAATDYFRMKAYEKLQNAFRPAIVAGMKEADVLRSYREMMEKYDYESVASFPVDHWKFDMEGYLTGKALDGLFRLLGEEEKKIRKEPAARSTELLRQVFGKPE